MASEQNLKRLQEEHLAASGESSKREEAIWHSIKLEEATRERGNAEAAEAKAKAEVITLKEQIGSMVEESESALANQQSLETEQRI